MKASYTKPLFGVELFSTNQSVARDCATKIQFNQTGMDTCGWDLGGVNNVVFVNTEKCTIDGTNMEEYCYNNPSEGNYIMHS